VAGLKFSAYRREPLRAWAGASIVAIRESVQHRI
jgi:hypothetical protein